MPVTYVDTNKTAPAEKVQFLRVQAEQAVKRGANWFVWIAALSVVNAIIVMSGEKTHFLMGLGITTFVDAIAQQAGSGGLFLEIALNGFAVGAFLLFWNFARKAQSWAFIVGMTIYALDGVLLLAFKDIPGVAFHGFALYSIYRGMKCVPILQKLRAALPASAAVSSSFQ